MSEEILEVKKRQSFVWVKDNSGNTYLCPKEALRDPKHVSEEELKECVDESFNIGEGG